MSGLIVRLVALVVASVAAHRLFGWWGVALVWGLGIGTSIDYTQAFQQLHDESERASLELTELTGKVELLTDEIEQLAKAVPTAEAPVPVEPDLSHIERRLDEIRDELSEIRAGIDDDEDEP